MVEFINRWSKVFAKIWFFGFIVFVAFHYNDSAQDTRKHFSSPLYADLNLLLPFSVQKMINPQRDVSINISSACTTVKKSPFERFVIGYRQYKGNGFFHFEEDYKEIYQGCMSGNYPVALGILFTLIWPFIALNNFLPWLTRVLTGAGKSYKSSAKKAKVNTEKNYLIAYKEVESGKIKSPELWAKAFAETEGDEVKQKALYVELRTKQLDELK
jgi:hypothetical protein